MSLDVYAGGLYWTPNPNGEHGEHTTTYSGELVTVYSDRSGEHWTYQRGDEESCQLEADNLEDALVEAAREAKS